MLQLTNYFWGSLFTLAFSLFTFSGNATICSISASGNDSNAGTSQNLPWKSLTKINSFTPKPGATDMEVDGIKNEVMLVMGNVSNSLKGSTYTIYLDPTYMGTNGTENGTIERPYNSFSDFTLQSNYTYLLKRGTTYTSSSKILLYRLSNVTVRDYGSGEKPIFNYTGSGNFYAFQFDLCTDCSVINIHLTAPTGTNMIAILGMGNNTGGFAGGTRITVDSCRIEKAGNDASGDYGIRAGGNQVKILNTIIRDISVDGIYARDCPGIEMGYLDISDVNRRYFSKTDPLYSAGDGIQIAGNYNGFHIHHTTINRTNGAGNKFNLIVGGGSGAANYSGIIEFCEFINSSNVGVSVYIGPGNGIITRYNKFKGTTICLYLAEKGSNNLIHNNLFYNSTVGVRISYPVTGTKVLNNIFYKVSRYHITVDRSAVEARNNIHLRSGDSGVALYNIDGGSWTLSSNCYGDIATAGIPGTGTNAVIGNPLFVNPDDYNFNIQNCSPCINAGVDVAIDHDFEGNSIPQGSAPDIGAYESILISLPDETKPVVTVFSVPETSSSLVVPVGSFTASDNQCATWFKLTEIATAPLPDDSGWNTVAPTSYTFNSEGTKTLYAWAKDAVGNISTSLNDMVVISLPDESKPVVTAFSVPETYYSLVVPVSNLTASDNKSVTGFKLTESATVPLPGDAGWNTVVPTSYTFNSEGNKTIYAWARDSAGNVSGSISDTVVITLPDMSPTYSEYLFEESSGLTVIDSKGSNNGTIINEELRAEGVMGNGLALNGTDYINLGQCFGENVENEVTLSAWIKPNTLTENYQGIIVHGGPNIDSYALYIRPESKSIDFVTNGTTNPLFTIDNVIELWDGNWHHIVVTYNGSEKVIYLDNIALIKIHATGKIESGWKYNLLIGSGRDEISPTLFYDGLIDEVRIYNYALTPSEISDLYHPVNKVIKKILTNEYISICEGEEYIGWSETGIFKRVLKRILPSTSGADSIITTNLKVNPVYKSSDKAIICEGDIYNFGIQLLTVTGEYTELFEAVDGCDSTVILTLTVNPEFNITDEANICEGETYIFGTQALALSGKYTEVFKTVNGCDSSVILTLSVNSGFNIIDEANICEGESYFFGNQTLTISGMYTEIFKTVNACDSTVFLKLNVNPVQNKIEEISISSNENYLGWTEEGIYQRVLVSSTGCDSIIVTNLKVEKTLTQFIDLENGWNIFSSWLIPTNDDMSSVMETLQLEGKLIKVQDELDNTYEELYPQTGWINNIGNLRETEGYKIRVESNCILEIKGLPTGLPLSIELKPGINIISFPTNGSINAMQVIQSLIDTGILEKIQDEKGKSIEYWSGLGWINDIGNFNSGEGYILRVNNYGILTINETSEKSSLYFTEDSETTYFKVKFEGNGFDHMNINVTGLKETQFSVGDEIAIFDKDICVGAIKLTEKHFSLNAVSIPSSASEMKSNNGFTEGNSVELKVWDIKTDKEVKYLPEIIRGEMVFKRQASVFIKLTEVTEFAEDIDIYPNPASSKVYIQLPNIPKEGANISLQDINGKQILSRKVRSNPEIISIENLPSGMYFIKTLIKNKFTTYKIIIS